MPNPLLISEINTRSLAAVARSFKEGHSGGTIETMKVEIRKIAREVARWQLSGEAKARIFLRPMEEVLVNHYGAINGRRLYWDFFDAFWLQSWTEVPLLTEPKADNEVERRATG